MKSDKKEIKKPLVLELEECKSEIAAAIVSSAKKHGLTNYFVEQILGRLYNEIANAAKTEHESLKSFYEAQLEASQNNEADKDGHQRKEEMSNGDHNAESIP